MSSLPSHHSADWPMIRNAVLTTLNLHRRHTMYGIVEADITTVWSQITAVRREHQMAIPAHAYYLYALSRTLARHPALNTYRMGRKLITFRDVDVGTAAEKTDPVSGGRYAAGFVIRAAQTKSLAALCQEMRTALRRDPSEDPGAALRRKFARLPAVVRWWISRRTAANPFQFHKIYGTVGLTNLHLPGVGAAYTPLPPNPYTVTIALGGTITRTRLTEAGTPETRRFLPITIAVDHAIVDGMAACRFGSDLIHQIESGDGLGDAFIADLKALRAAEGSR